MESLAEETFELLCVPPFHAAEHAEPPATETNTLSSFERFGADQEALPEMLAFLDESSPATNDRDHPQTSDSMDNLLANLTEDNANSLPSTGDADGHFASSILESRGLAQTNEFVSVSPPRDVVSVTDESSASSSVVAAQADDDVPNGDDNSQATAADVDADMVSEDEFAAPAQHVTKTISDYRVDNGVRNGDPHRIEGGAADVDAEMVSEDELPAPTQEKVVDAEEVSDEELPGPKLAELPADTEVVSEDELPTPVKRKLDDGYDPGSPTESSEIPEKKSKKADDDGEEHCVFFFD